MIIWIMIIKNLELKIACTKGAQIWLKFSAFFYFIFKSLLSWHCFSKLFLASTVARICTWNPIFGYFTDFYNSQNYMKAKHEVKIQRSINLNFKNMRAPKCEPKKVSTSKICTNVIKLPKNKHRSLQGFYRMQFLHRKVWFFNPKIKFKIVIFQGTFN